MGIILIAVSKKGCVQKKNRILGLFFLSSKLEKKFQNSFLKNYTQKLLFPFLFLAFILKKALTRDCLGSKYG